MVITNINHWNVLNDLRYVSLKLITSSERGCLGRKRIISEQEEQCSKLFFSATVDFSYAGPSKSYQIYFSTTKMKYWLYCACFRGLPKNLTRISIRQMFQDYIKLNYISGNDQSVIFEISDLWNYGKFRWHLWILNILTSANLETYSFIVKRIIKI